MLYKFKLYLFLLQLHRKLIELIDTFLKARMLASCGQTWWRKPENPEKTTDLGLATTTLSHALTRIRTRTAEVTSECVIHYAIQDRTLMIYTNFVELHWMMLLAMFQNHKPSGSGEDFLKVVFFLFIAMVAILVM